MNMRELVRMMLLQFFICYTCTMAATLFFSKFVNTPPIMMLEIDYLWHCGIFSIFAILPGAVYYSGEELSTKQWKNRTIAHTILLLAVLMTAGRIINMYENLIGGVLFFITVLVIDGLVRWLTYLGDQKIADAINKELKETRERDEAYH